MPDVRVVIIRDLAELRPSKQGVSSIPALAAALEDVDIILCDASDCYKADIDILSDYNVRPEQVALLYPSDASEPLPNAPFDPNQACDDRSRHEVKVLVVLDGSWVTVQHILARNPFLHPGKCRHVRLPSSDVIAASVYHTSGLRKEPNEGFVSTAEAVAWALHFLSVDMRPISQKILENFQRFVESKINTCTNTNSTCSYSSTSRLGCSSDGASCSDSDCDDSSKESGLALEPNAASLLAERQHLRVMTLLPAGGVRFKKPISKAQKRKRSRDKEKMKHKRKRC